jgi:hypothetical protein
MHAPVTVTPAQLPDLLLHVAVVRPVFIWGQPGIGKSSLVAEFTAQVGLAWRDRPTARSGPPASATTAAPLAQSVAANGAAGAALPLNLT